MRLQTVDARLFRQISERCHVVLNLDKLYHSKCHPTSKSSDNYVHDVPCARCIIFSSAVGGDKNYEGLARNFYTRTSKSSTNTRSLLFNLNLQNGFDWRCIHMRALRLVTRHVEIDYSKVHD